MKKYSSYKPSGIEWLETIPENWEVSKLKYLGNLYGGLTGKSGGDFNNDENPKNKPYIPYTNIFNNTYISKDHFHYVSIDEGESQNRVKKYDMFFLMSSETHKDLGKSCILIDDVDELYLNSFCKGYRIKDKNIQPLFLNYQILGHLHREMISIEGKGFTRINLRQDKINDLVVFYPPLEEQEQIVNYLDEKTTIIDKLISTKQRKIELLKEQRTTLVNQVITKGLNPDVKMKDSGVEWIGEIPENWKITSLGKIGTLYGGLTGKSGDDFRSEDNPMNKSFIPFTNIFNNTYISKDHFQYVVVGDDEKQNRVKKFDLFFLMSSEGYDDLGKSSILIEDVEEVYLNSFCKGFRVQMLDVYPLFLNYQLLGDTHKKLISIEGNGFTRINLRQDRLKETPIFLPSYQEQQEIVEYLDKHIKDIDDLVFMEQNKIELLKEYRQSLISEVITGKIKVV
jgi:type I restriction enzyme S subunit